MLQRIEASVLRVGGLMGSSLSMRLRPTVPSTSRSNVQMLRLDETVVMEVRGRHIEPRIAPIYAARQTDLDLNYNEFKFR